MYLRCKFVNIQIYSVPVGSDSLQMFISYYSNHHWCFVWNKICKDKFY